MESNTGKFNNIKLIVLSVLLVGAIAAIIMLIIPKERKINELEKIGLDGFSNKAINYMEELDRTVNADSNTEALKDNLQDNNVDRFIAYALEYAYGEQNKTSINADEINEIISNIFDVKLDKEKVGQNGISPILLDKRVNHDPINMTYSIIKSGLTKRDIAAISVTKYIQRSIKVDGDDYVITYDKYVIKNPYDALVASEGSMTGVNDYLNGNGKVSAIKNIVNADNVEKVATKEKETIITVTAKDGKILIKSVK